MSVQIASNYKWADEVRLLLNVGNHIQSKRTEAYRLTSRTGREDPSTEVGLVQSVYRVRNIIQILRRTWSISIINRITTYDTVFLVNMIIDNAFHLILTYSAQSTT